jgi:hypothetical protein
MGEKKTEQTTKIIALMKPDKKQSKKKPSLHQIILQAYTSK